MLNVSFRQELSLRQWLGDDGFVPLPATYRSAPRLMNDRPELGSG